MIKLNTIISFTPLQLIGVFLSTCAAIVTILAAINAINAFLDKWKSKKQKPEDIQNDKIANIEKMLMDHDKRFEKYDEILNKDSERLEKIEESMRIDRKGFLALIKHAIDGNDIESLKESRKELEEYLINKA